MPVNNPAALVEEFKKSGEFDRIRRELLVQFREKEEAYTSLKARVEEIGRQRLAADQTLKFLPNHDFVQKELMQEIERYPIIERAVADVRIFNDAAFISNLDSSIRKTLNDGQGGGKSAVASTTGKETPVPTQTEPANASVASTDPAQPALDTKPTLVTSSSSSTDLKPPRPSLNSPSSKAPQHSSTSPPTTTTTGTLETQGRPSGPENGTVDPATKPPEPSTGISTSNTETPIENAPDADVEMKDVAS
ncbi:hypothetical protein D9619_000275 [Psilocybe cf. subviscida]|uniref:BOD1/SHG1 domain-containing protein n=1 Tax=Psilocybe cf. subviscida TaxID=2480587 RepID=A0A8H5F240_9AGAR|nr:hypothetical protein D9619_000275 [Psilocybe cf. subviscida]